VVACTSPPAFAIVRAELTSAPARPDQDCFSRENDPDLSLFVSSSVFPKNGFHFAGPRSSFMRSIRAVGSKQPIMANSKIKPKAMGIFAHDGRMLVMDCFDTVKQKPFYRLLGGHIEFGELAPETFRREMMEELGTEVEVYEQLDVVQNVFTFEGKPHHEVIFIHRVGFADLAYYAREDLRNIEPGMDEPFPWVPISDILNGPKPLFPNTDYKALLERIGAL
jgi:8-oxo-dGTP pyrophosphatase MutT (NUDIX family)